MRGSVSKALQLGCCICFTLRAGDFGAPAWGTFYGGSATDRGYSVAVDANGDAYLGGFAASDSQIAYSGLEDSLRYRGSGFIAKFSSDGQRQWGTYFAGDYGTVLVMVFDAAGNRYLAGSTKSSDGIATSGAHQETYGGLKDGFVIKLDPDGNKLWGTYFGGDKDDIVTGIAFSNDGHLYLIGESNSTTGIATDGAFQDWLYGAEMGDLFEGWSDGFLAKFTVSGERVWSTYFGGPRPESVNAIVLDANNNVYIGGNTLSRENIASSGSYQTDHNIVDTYTADGFLAKFTPDGNRVWSTYYGGTAAESINSLIWAPANGLYVGGATCSETHIAADGYTNEPCGGWDGFVAKFDADGGRQWGSYFGGAGKDEINSIHLVNGVLYAVGSTDEAMPVPVGDGYRSTVTGGTDAFIAALNSAGQPQAISYWGGERNEVVSGAVFVGSGSVYIAGSTYSTDSLAINGHQDANGGLEDAYLLKLDGAITLPVSPSFVSHARTAVPYRVTVRNRVLTLTVTEPEMSLRAVLVDPQGRVVFDRRPEASARALKHPLTKCSKGMYVLTLRTPSTTYVEKLVVR